MNLKDKFVKISAERYYELLKAENHLDALEGCGVDNWNGYDDHFDYLTSEDDLLNEVYSNIINPF